MTIIIQFISSALISPDGSSIVIANYEGLFLIDIETKEITQLTEKRDFISGNGQWESINSSFNSPWFSADGAKIYFSITLNYFGDGC
ncbi:MAG: hypothetical protein U5K71_15320 [Gracilimonas sp.]|nr:hypothetical protein [Gracilimonas sp.]